MISSTQKLKPSIWEMKLIHNNLFDVKLQYVYSS